MKWTDLADGVWTIATEPREKGNAGVLRLPQIAWDLITAQPRLAGNPYVFPAAVGNGSINSFSQRKHELEAKLSTNVPTWTLHDLRRTARSLMSRAGVRPDIAERVLGHAIPGVEGVYDRHRYEHEKTGALQTLAELLQLIVDGPVKNIVQLSRTAAE